MSPEIKAERVVRDIFREAKLKEVLHLLGSDKGKTKEDVIRERDEYIRQALDNLTDLVVARNERDAEFARRVNTEAVVARWERAVGHSLEVAEARARSCTEIVVH